MQMVVSDLWKSNKAGTLELIHPYDLDLTGQRNRVERL
jgi:hypothetical protein